MTSGGSSAGGMLSGIASTAVAAPARVPRPSTSMKALLPYQVNAAAMALAKPDAIFMHCLPSYHDLKTAIGREVGEKYGLDALEVTDEVFEGPQSVVFDEAENRLHTIKAVMAATLQ